MSGILGPDGAPLFGPGGEPATSTDCCCDVVPCSTPVDMPATLSVTWLLELGSVSGYNQPTIPAGMLTGTAEIDYDPLTGSPVSCTWTTFISGFTVTGSFDDVDTLWGCDTVTNLFSGPARLRLYLDYQNGTWTADASILTDNAAGDATNSACGLSGPWMWNRIGSTGFGGAISGTMASPSYAPTVSAGSIVFPGPGPWMPIGFQVAHQYPVTPGNNLFCGKGTAACTQHDYPYSKIAAIARLYSFSVAW